MRSLESIEYACVVNRETEAALHVGLMWLMRRVQETLDEAGYPQMPQLAARLRHGESLDDYHFFESLQEAADTIGPADALPVDAR